MEGHGALVPRVSGAGGQQLGPAAGSMPGESGVRSSPTSKGSVATAGPGPRCRRGARRSQHTGKLTRTVQWGESATGWQVGVRGDDGAWAPRRWGAGGGGRRHEARPPGDGAEDRRGLLAAGPEFRREEGKSPKVGKGWKSGSQHESHRTRRVRVPGGRGVCTFSA